MIVHLTCVIFHIIVAVIEQEKRAAQKEREALLANFEQHKQLHIQQEEEKRKVSNQTLELL